MILGYGEQAAATNNHDSHTTNQHFVFMARVQKVPQYKYQTEAKGLFPSLSKGFADVAIDAALGIEHVSTAGMDIDAIGETDDFSLKEDAVYNAFKGQEYDYVCCVALLWKQFIKTRGWKDSKTKIYAGSRAVSMMQAALYSNQIGISNDIQKEWMAADKIGKIRAAYGMIGSFGSYNESTQRAKEVLGFNELYVTNVMAAKCLALGDVLHSGLPVKKSWIAWREAIEKGKIEDIEQLRIKGGPVVKHLSKSRVYFVGGTFIFEELDSREKPVKAYIFGDTHRRAIADILISTGQTILYALQYRINDLDQKMAEEKRNAAIQIVNRGMAYLRRNIPRACADTDETFVLAKYLKNIHTIKASLFRVNDLSTTEDEKKLAIKLADRQKQVFKDLAKKHQFDDWLAEIDGFDEEVFLDVGTIWNNIHCADQDPAKVDARIEQDFNSARKPLDKDDDEFLIYARSVISAHIVFSMREKVDEFKFIIEDDQGPAEERDWVISCLKGKLMYPKREERCFVGRILRWRNVANIWHFSAQDVTHIMAKLECYNYADSISSLPKELMNELLYALAYAPYLSAKHLPSHVRQEWLEGRTVGEAIDYLSIKMENTKGNENGRDIHSGDDVGREMRSEYDINISVIGSMLDGVISRMGRARMERQFAKACKAMSHKNLLLSLDIKGWSPRMRRELEMAFGDVCLGFFDIPDSAKTENIFPKATMIMSHGGYHRVWASKDGSVQGYFPTLDGMLNGLIAQYAFVLAREHGLFEDHSRMNKLTLIDDLLAILRRYDGDIETATEAFIATYAKLGFEIEVDKSIIRKYLFVFLNRLFYNKNEIITSCKVFARGDITREQTFRGCWNEFDALFGSFLGAVDRGADPVATYTWVHIRIAKQSMVYDKDCAKENTKRDTTSVWASRDVLGWGLLRFNAWITRTAVTTLEGGFAVPTILVRHLKKEKPPHTETPAMQLSLR